MPVKSTVLFLCQHGGAKSVLAASYFNRFAEQNGLEYVGVAASAEEPYEAVPPPVADLLEQDGFDVRAFRPRQVEEPDVKDAMKVVSIGCDLTKSGLSTEIEQWNDVPPASEDLTGSAAAIRRHVETLAEELLGRR